MPIKSHEEFKWLEKRRDKKTGTLEKHLYTN